MCWSGLPEAMSRRAGTAPAQPLAPDREQATSAPTGRRASARADSYCAGWRRAPSARPPRRLPAVQLGRAARHLLPAQVHQGGAPEVW